MSFIHCDCRNDVAGLGLDVEGLDVAGLDVAGLDVAGLGLTLSRNPLHEPDPLRLRNDVAN
jgi:hypothetical protein